MVHQTRDRFAVMGWTTALVLATLFFVVMQAEALTPIPPAPEFDQVPDGMAVDFFTTFGEYDSGEELHQVWYAHHDPSGPLLLFKNDAFTGGRAVATDPTRSPRPGISTIDFGPYEEAVVEIHFYDSGASDLSGLGFARGRRFVFYAGLQPQGGDFYVTRHSGIEYQVSQLERTPGWHLLRFIVEDGYKLRTEIDGTTIYEGESDRFEALIGLRLGAQWPVTSEPVIFDAVRVLVPTSMNE